MANQSAMQNQGLRQIVNSNYDPRYAGAYANYGNLNYSSLMNQNTYGYAMQHQQQYGMHQQQQPNIARNLKVTNLPFYDNEYVSFC